MHALVLAALITVIPASQRFGTKITIALDVSGSLYAHRVAALDAALEVLSLTATDETEVRLATFGGASHVSPVFQHPVDPNAARTWLIAHTPPGSSCTVIKPTLDAALDWGDVIIVSDMRVDDAVRCSTRKGRTVGVVLVGHDVPASLRFASRIANGGVFRRPTREAE